LSDILYVFTRLNLLNAIDILLVALIIYGLFRLIQGTQAVQLLRGVIIVVLLTILITSILKLTAFSWLIRNSLSALLVAIPVIFQPELRRALERVGRAGFSMNRQESTSDRVIEEVCQACQRLSERRHGTLIVLERETGLQEYIDTGTKIGAKVSAELLLTIFFPNTALHDGAVIIREDEVVAAGCVLPLAGDIMPDRQLGLRHRAAVGVTEETDAISIVVSEETGIISITHNGRMIRRLDAKRLGKILQAFHKPQPLGGLRTPLRMALPDWLDWVRRLTGRV
jgi:diadenylate cyclase